MKSFVLLLGFFSLFSAAYAQKSTDSVYDSLMISTLQRSIDLPDHLEDSVGIIIIEIEKINDSLSMQLIYSSFKFPFSLNECTRSTRVLTYANAVPNGYKCVVPIHFCFDPRDGNIIAPSQNANASSKKKIESLNRNFKVLEPIVFIGYEPSCVKKYLSSLDILRPLPIDPGVLPR